MKKADFNLGIDKKNVAPIQKKVVKKKTASSSNTRKRDKGIYEKRKAELEKQNRKPYNIDIDVNNRDMIAIVAKLEKSRVSEIYERAILEFIKNHHPEIYKVYEKRKGKK